MPRLISYLRMSTSEQLKGISLERQRKLIADFASKNDLSIEDSYSIEEIGSSFKEDEEQKKLTKFFEDLEKNKFQKGDVFALENIDRLTRRGAIDALIKVNRIISKGLKLAIISDKEQRILEEIDVFSIITLSIDASRANKESEVKSQKGLINWQEKRELAVSHNLAMTSQAPAWIDTEIFYVLDEEKKKQIKRRRYVLNEEKAKTVRLIFDLFQKGNGALKIKNYLNENKIPQFKGLEFWEPSTISKIIKNPATFGFYQPKQQRNGKRDLVPACEPIENYFPAVIDRKTFDQCQRITESNTTRKGRKGKVFTNLFTGLLKCTDCGGSVHLLNPGIDKRNKTPKTINYLVCKKGKFTKECTTKRIRYEDFENSILKAVQEIKLSDVLNEQNPLENLIEKQREIETEIKNKKALIESYEKHFEKNNDLPDFMIAKAKEAEQSIKTNEIKKIEIMQEITHLSIFDTNIDKAIEELRSNATYEQRAKINLLFHDILKSIKIDFELKDYAIIFKNDVKRFVDSNDNVQNVFKTDRNSELYKRELEEILNYKK